MNAFVSLMLTLCIATLLMPFCYTSTLSTAAHILGAHQAFTFQNSNWFGLAHSLLTSQRVRDVGDVDQCSFTVYVDVDRSRGRDTNSGLITSPITSFYRALELIRKTTAAVRGMFPCVVCNDGTYYLYNTTISCQSNHHDIAAILAFDVLNSDVVVSAQWTDGDDFVGRVNSSTINRDKVWLLVRSNPRQRYHQAKEEVCLSRTSVSAAILSARKRLLSMIERDGRFIYHQDLDSQRKFKSQYNSIRHAGAIYSLTHMSFHENNMTEYTALIRKITQYFTKTFIVPIETPTNSMFAIVTDTKGPPATAIVHLGGAALGLVALLSVETGIQKETTRRDLIFGLAQFLIFMQKPNGEFYTRYHQLTVNRDDRDPSLYYPGETILALIMMYEWCHDIQWLRAAEFGLIYLAKTRQKLTDTPPDNWALIATAHIWAHRSQFKHLSADELLRHAQLVVRSDLIGQITDPSDHSCGCFVNDGRTTPTSTRLEGLLAILPVLASVNRTVALVPGLLRAIKLGISFLLRAQIPLGPFAGAITKSVLPSRSKHSTEVRIDYIQHALSAFIQYRALIASHIE